MTINKIEQLKKEIIEANEAYRTGEAIMSDSEYDDLLEELTILSPNEELLLKVGHAPVDESRKRKLPIKMASMNKIKTIEEFKDWLRLKKIPEQAILILTPKFDGLSLCKNEVNGDAWTRGDGEYGQLSTEHIKLIVHAGENKNDFYSFGEVIMSRKKFNEKYKGKMLGDKIPKNPRNLVSGKMNDKKPHSVLKDCDYIRYGLVQHNGDLKVDKDHQLDILNSLNTFKVRYEKIKASEITTDFLVCLFKKWNQEYELDGIIIEVNDHELREKLGRETSTQNPVFARAFKGNFEEVKESKVLDITWQVSKQGYLKPVAQIEPIELDGATVSNVTGINARFVGGYGLKKGTSIMVKRSGMVIPLFVEINGVKVQKDFLPVENAPWPVFNCPVCDSSVKWNESGVELMCSNALCEGSNLQRIIAFFEILEVEGVSDGVCEILFNFGYNTIDKILNMSKDDMLSLEGFAKRKTEITFNNIHSKLKNVPLSKIQHASGCFEGLGSKKLLLLEHFEKTPTLSEVIAIEGFSDKSAEMYLKGLEPFKQFMKNLPITIRKTEKIKPVSNDLNGQSYVFTGVRRPDLETIIQSKGGTIGSGVSKNTSVLCMKEKGSGSSKEQKAIALGVRIVNVAELEKELGF